MNLDILSIVIILLCVIPLLKGILYKYSPDNFKREIIGVVKIISFIIGLLSGFYLCKKFILYDSYRFFSDFLSNLIGEYITIFSEKPILIYLIVAPVISIIITVIVYKILNILLNVFIYPLFDIFHKWVLKRGNFLKSLLGLILSIPKALFYPLIFCTIIHFYSLSYSNEKIDDIIFNSSVNDVISEKIIVPIVSNEMVNHIPNIVNQSLKIDISQVEDAFTENLTIYYNGVTLDEGIKSNDEINELTLLLCEDGENDREKAFIIYSWITENLIYDEDKANDIINDNFEIESGAISAFKSRKGVCFDFACLYTAMAKAAGLKVRIVTGKGFSGEVWVDHSWNEVYINEKDKWIKVDTTFGLAGNYFDNLTFNLDHTERKIIGEWN
ncbi:transglutaminase domain-containing protein [Oceanirhabdus sp. W0125-5]|uniref:transglutaminase domain-containing protein n=1 Tax=Oceanirhabdus sp. W0125-5 TaxID=2999116 RepID=UPI0022F3399D|nr:transglutaminase-like domain-containing protein [Oceanirhabdus sp. W0125-5]WBW98742.1 transglutaminase-like domain-containing protein [Oceanirhabdus sp. W0125-5]